MSEIDEIRARHEAHGDWLAWFKSSQVEHGDRGWLLDEVEALRRDARRYRWLRNMIYDDRIIVAADRMLHGEALDAAIDAAGLAVVEKEDGR